MRCYISWKGKVLVMHSDNGTNFDGANKELKTCIRNLTQTKIQYCLSSQNIGWVFNPSVSLGMGDLGIINTFSQTSIKSHCKRQAVTEESLYIFLCEVETLNLKLYLNLNSFTDNSQ